MSKTSLSRRKFLLTAGVAGASVAAKSILLEPGPLFASPRAVPPSDRVRFGIIGVGMEGTSLLTTAVALPGVECVAASDLYDGRHELAKEIVGKPIKTTRRYKELLDDKEIDAIIIAVPDHWHKQVVVDAVTAGKDVYCEKPMSHSAADGVAMVEACQENRPYRSDWRPAHQLRPVRESQRTLRKRRDRRALPGRSHLRAERSHRRLGISSAR